MFGLGQASNASLRLYFWAILAMNNTTSDQSRLSITPWQPNLYNINRKMDDQMALEHFSHVVDHFLTALRPENWQAVRCFMGFGIGPITALIFEGLESPLA